MEPRGDYKVLEDALRNLGFESFGGEYPAVVGIQQAIAAAYVRASQDGGYEVVVLPNGLVRSSDMLRFYSVTVWRRKRVTPAG